MARLLNADELGLKDAVVSLREADEPLKDESEPVPGVDSHLISTYAAAAEANRAGIERMEAMIRQAGEERG